MHGHDETESSVRTPLPIYDIHQDYDWNYAHAPKLSMESTDSMDPVPGQWTYAGLSVPSPLAMAAGPLLNSQWLLYYARLGFDVLTYKTVRRCERASYPMPNLVPVVSDPLMPGVPAVNAQATMGDAWAVSFGMPSKMPAVWRSDVALCRSHLASHQILSVSVVATPDETTSAVALGEDYAQCALWAFESGADVVELNFSCPNVSTSDGQLSNQLDAAKGVLETVRAAVGDRPLLVKLGVVDDMEQIDLWIALAQLTRIGLVMINCVGARVRAVGASSNTFHFGGDSRGIAGKAIAPAVKQQFHVFAEARKRQKASVSLLPVGGIDQAEEVTWFLDRGAEAIQVATAPMLNPHWAMEIRQSMQPTGYRL